MATKKDDAGLSGDNTTSPAGADGTEWNEWADRVEQRLSAVESKSADGGSAADTTTLDNRLNAIDERLNKMASDSEKFRVDNTRVEGAPEALEGRVATLEAASTDLNSANDKWGKDVTDRLDIIERDAAKRQSNAEAMGGYVTRQQLTQAMEQAVQASRPNSTSAYVTRSEVETLIERKIEAAKKPFA